jgi:hypothetical protein
VGSGSSANEGDERLEIGRRCDKPVCWFFELGPGCMSSLLALRFKGASSESFGRWSESRREAASVLLGGLGLLSSEGGESLLLAGGNCLRMRARKSSSGSWENWEGAWDKSHSELLDEKFMVDS